MDFDSRGKLYGGSGSTLSRINATTGHALPITSAFIDVVTGVTLSPDDRLFVVNASFQAALYEVDKRKGTVLSAVFLSSELTQISSDGADFTPDGTLYILIFGRQFSFQPELITIHPSTGAIIDGVPLRFPPGLFGIPEGLDIGPDGLFRTNIRVPILGFEGAEGSELATIDPATGVVEVVGRTGTTPPAVFLFGLASKP